MSAKLGTLTLDLVARTSSFTQDMKSAGDSVTREAKRIETGVDSAATAFKRMGALAAASLAGLTVGSVIESADAYVQMAAQIRNATNSTAEYDQVQKHLLQTANTTYRSLQEAQQVYLDVGGALKAYGATTEQALRITDSLSFSYTHNATAADKASTATNAFMKSLYEGKVSGDSWRSMLSAIPSIVDDLARSTGKTKAEILSLGNAGAITTEQLKTSFDQNRELSEDLANSMENSLKDGLTNLSTAWTTFVGEINLSYSVTNKMAGALGILADNLGLVTGIATVGAAFWAGTYIPTAYASILALKEKVATQIQSMRTEQIANEVTANRTARIAQSTAAELANAEAQLARMSGMARIAYLESTVLPLRQANTAALAADTVAQNANNTSKNLGVAAGSRLATALMGPVGLGLAVATVAAGFLLMSGKTKEATKSLKEQGDTVDDVTKKYAELNAEAQRAQLRTEKKLLDELTDSYKDAGDQLKDTALAVAASAVKSREASLEVKNLADQYDQGKITSSELADKLNKLSGITEHGKAQIDKQAVATYDLSKKMGDQKSIVISLTNENSALAKSHDGVTKSIQQQHAAQQQLNKEQQSVFDRIQEQIQREAYIEHNVALGWSRERATFGADIRKEANMGYTGTAMPAELAKMADASWKIQQQAEARKKAEKGTAKALKDQEGSAKRLVGISGNSGIGTGAHLDIRYGGSRGGHKVSKEHLARIQAGGKSLSSYRMSSDYGPRKAPTKGASTFHKGIDFAMPVGTPLTTNVAVKDVQTKHEAGKGYYSIVTFEDGVVLELLHQAPGMKDKVKGGASDGTFKSAQDIQKQADDQARNQIQLELNVADEVTRIRMNLAEDLKEIDKAGYSNKDASALKAKYTERAENDIAIAQQALKTKVDSYSEYLKTEEQLLRDSYAARQVEVLNDFTLSKAQREKASDHLQKQMQLEINAAKRAEEMQVNSAMEVYRKQSEVVVERYEIERQEILETYRLTQETRNKLIEANRMGVFSQLNMGSDQVRQYGADANYAMHQRNDPAQYGQWQGGVAQSDMQNAYSTSMSGLKSSYDDQVAGINMLENEEQRNAELLAAHEQYLQAREALDAQYQQTEQDNQMAMHASNLAAYGSAFGAMADMVKGYAGEASGAYQALAIVQKSANLASVIMNGYATISAAWASAPFPANLVNVATATASTGVLQAAMQAFTPNIKGMAHNGIDNIPKEGTWLLDGGERVLNPQQNKDLTNYLSNSKGGGGDVIIYNNTSAQVSAEQRDGKTYVTIDEVKRFMVDQVNSPNSDLNKNLRQSYELKPRR